MCSLAWEMLRSFDSSEFRELRQLELLHLGAVLGWYQPGHGTAL